MHLHAAHRTFMQNLCNRNLGSGHQGAQHPLGHNTGLVPAGGARPLPTRMLYSLHQAAARRSPL